MAKSKPTNEVPEPDGTARTLERRLIADLRPHPRQAEFFDDLSTKKLNVLVESISQHGMLDPPDVLPNGIIVNGHQRIKAATKIGWTYVKVYVRHDLAQAGEAAVEAEVIRDNLERRHLGLLDQARCYQALKMQGKQNRRQPGIRTCDLRDELAEKIGGMSGRQFERYVELLKLPRPLQTAYSCGDLTASRAKEILKLPKEEQERLAADYEAGKPLKVTVHKKPDGPAATGMIIRSLEQAIDRGLDGLQDSNGKRRCLTANQRRKLGALSRKLAKASDLT